MNIRIVSRWDSEKVLFEHHGPSVFAALRAAIKAGANLYGADLTRANLTGANLYGADLTRANLTGANLTGANLTGANLTDANLTDADLTDADLTDADLTDADLTDADLTGANLTGADLYGANLYGADLSAIRDDVRSLVAVAPSEALALLNALKTGKVDGSHYQGECACLVGTIANVSHKHYRSIPYLTPDSGRPAERFALAICKGDTPATNPVSALTAKWIEEWLNEHHGRALSFAMRGIL